MSDRPPTCATQKRGYRSEIDAKLAIAYIDHADSSRAEKKPVRAYCCPRCRWWHLTSQPKRGQ